jgi:hypothetical protein
MRKISLFFMIFTLIFMLAAAPGMAQEIKFPKASQKAIVSQEIGLSEVTITYHRPGVKGRVIWGELVPYDKVWRTGANNATTISFSSDVTINEQALKAGTYGLFTIPGKESWVVIFSKQADIWGAMGYKEEQDALRIKVKPKAVPHGTEWMMFHFSDLSEDSAVVNLGWEKINLAFTVKVETQKKVLKSIERTMGRYWVPPYSAANYALKNDMLDKAKQYVSLSVSINATYWNMLLKAKIYRKLAKTKKEKKETIKILEKAILLGKKLPERQQRYVKEANDLLKEWTGK